MGLLENTENLQQYVVRKLNQGIFNLKQVSVETDIHHLMIYSIRDGNNSTYLTIQTLHDFFKKAAD